MHPLLNELELLAQPLDKEEFVDAATRLYDVSYFQFLFKLFIDSFLKRKKHDFEIRQRET